MANEQNLKKSAVDRRTLLQAGLAVAFAGPAGALGAQAFSPRAAFQGVDFSEFPLCKTASDAPALTGAPRKLKLSWNAGAVCLAPLPMSDHAPDCASVETSTAGDCGKTYPTESW